MITYHSQEKVSSKSPFWAEDAKLRRGVAGHGRSFLRTECWSIWHSLGLVDSTHCCNEWLGKSRHFMGSKAKVLRIWQPFISWIFSRCFPLTLQETILFKTTYIDSLRLVLSTIWFFVVLSAVISILLVLQVVSCLRQCLSGGNRSHTEISLLCYGSVDYGTWLPSTLDCTDRSMDFSELSESTCILWFKHSLLGLRSSSAGVFHLGMQS